MKPLIIGLAIFSLAGTIGIAGNELRSMPDLTPSCAIARINYMVRFKVEAIPLLDYAAACAFSTMQGRVK